MVLTLSGLILRESAFCGSFMSSEHLSVNDENKFFTANKCLKAVNIPVITLRFQILVFSLKKSPPGGCEAKYLLLFCVILHIKIHTLPHFLKKLFNFGREYELFVNEGEILNFHRLRVTKVTFPFLEEV